MLLAAAWPTLAAERQSEPEADLPQAPSGTREFHVLDPQLASLIEELLVGNPELRAAREFSLSQSQRARQESALPDPEFEYRLFLSNPETRVGPQEQSLRISQELPWFGKRGLQGERADHTATGVSWRARSLERERVAELKRAYFDAAYLQEALAVNADEGALLRRFEQIALTRYAVGEGVQQSAIRVQTDISRLTEREIALTQELDAIERRITSARPGYW